MHLMALSALPTHIELAVFFQKLLPPAIGAKEAPFHYHTPRHPAYNPAQRRASRVILSVQPTPGVYEACSDRAVRNILCFLHQPWKLDRRALRHDTAVLSSHASFDEHLTVGWNVALAERLNVDVPNATCIRGYQDNPDRKIGLIGTLPQPVRTGELVQKLKQEYDGEGELYGSDIDEHREVRVLAIMNAFDEEQLVRVMQAAREKGWIENTEDGSEILYLTGAARENGLEALSKYKMPAYFVGHRACEEWGVRYMAGQLRRQWSSLDVLEVLEVEMIVEGPPKKKTGPPVSATVKSIPRPSE